MHVKAGACLEVEICTLEIIANNQRWQLSLRPGVLAWHTPFHSLFTDSIMHQDGD